MKNMFLNKEFEFGGKLQNLDEKEGIYNGIYIIVQPNNFGKVVFNPQSKLKIWKKGVKERIVSASIEELQENWVEKAEILYIGNCASKTKNVQSLVKLHIRFWNGENVSAFGGRFIGQIQNWENLEVWYLKSDNSAQMKDELLRLFENQYRKLPFANLEH